MNYYRCEYQKCDLKEPLTHQKVTQNTTEMYKTFFIMLISFVTLVNLKLA